MGQVLKKDFLDTSLSTLGMGTMRLPVKGLFRSINQPDAQSIIDHCMESGINYYDTAAIYHKGSSETFLGDAFRRYDRDSYYLATKFFLLLNPNYKNVFEKQLRKMKTERIDFYLMHSLVDATYRGYIKSDAYDYYAKQKEKGRIRYIGFSSHMSPACLEKVADAYPWDFAQIQINYYDWFFGTAKQEYEILRKRKIPIMVMEPVRGGKLAKLSPKAHEILQKAHPDWSDASWAFRFLRSLSGLQVILSGMTTMDQLTDNIHTFSEENEFSKEDEAILLESCGVTKAETAVPCTACRYCCDDCPKHIDIPLMMDIYNQVSLGEGQMRDLIAKAKSKGKPKDCISCGSCTRHCPQNIEIPDILHKMSEA